MVIKGRISNDLLMETLLDKNKLSTETTSYYRIQKITEDSLIVKYIGSSLKNSPQLTETDDPYIEYYFKVK